MEPTSRARARGGRGVRGVRSRGSMEATRGVRGVRTLGGQRGGGFVRPSVSKPVFCGMLENFPELQPLERSIHPKRKRVLPDPVAKKSRSEYLRSIMEKITPSTSRAALSGGQEASPWPPMPAAPSEAQEPPPPVTPLSGDTLPAPGPPINTDVTVPSPSLYVKCDANSIASTHIITRPILGGGNRRSSLPLRDHEIESFPNYGSEEEYDEEEEEFAQMVLVPRAARMFVDEDDEDEEVEEGRVTISLEWPPRLSICVPGSPTPASPSASSASPTPVLPTSAPPTPGVEPSGKFQFHWRSFSMPQIEPNLRREPFSHISGPTISFMSPYEAFTSIWDREIMEIIVRETNIHAQQLAQAMLSSGDIAPNSRITRWQDTDVNEIYTYFAIILAMGIVVKSRLEEYWNKSKDIFSTPGFSTVMSIDRFLLLSKALHFNDNLNCDPAIMTRHEAKLYKIQPILDHLNRKFSQLYNLSQNVVLDESLTMWKGWLDINQFIRNKAATVGIKTYEVCESQTGYLWRFEVHAGYDTSAQREDEPVSGVVPALVLRLLNGLEHRGHTIWMDNFYTSPALARELKVRGFDCVGTLRTNRQFVPSELTSISKNDMTVGQVFGCTSGDVDLMVWRDKNRVAFISTYHGLATARCGDTVKPTVVHDYNICMGGVDRKDQQLAMYPIERRRTRVWYKNFFKKLLNASVLNSFILLNQSSLTHRKFRKVLIDELLTLHRKPTPTPTNQYTITSSIHSPAQYDLIKPGKTDRLKRQCAVCKKRTITYCKACDVAMCVFTCHEPYHTLKCVSL